MTNLMFPPPEGGVISGPCPVCREELDPKHSAECHYCLQYFHMRMTEDEAGRDAKDCGLVWLDEDYGIIFGCNTCIDELNIEPA